MHPAVAAALAAGTVTAAASAALAAYTITNHGANRLTLEAMKNLLFCHRHIDSVIALLGGKLNSAYRSPEINEAVGGSPTSDHMRGLAADVAPGKAFTVESAFNRLRELIPTGAIGPVRQLIWEPSWVHVGWLAPGAAPRALSLLKKVGPDFVVVK